MSSESLENRLAALLGGWRVLTVDGRLTATGARSRISEWAIGEQRRYREDPDLGNRVKDYASDF